MSDITLSAGIRQNLLSLQQTSANLTTTQEHLATGKKVNTAFDNPTSYFTAQSLTNRASDLSTLLDQIGQGIQTLDAANNGLTSITQLLQQALSTAKQAQSAPEPTFGTDLGTLTTSAGSVGASGTGNIVLTVSNGSSYTVAVAATDTAATILANINSTSGLGSGGAVSATTDSGGHLELLGAVGNSFTVTGSAATAAIGLTSSSSANATATYSANTPRTIFQSNYNALLTQIDQLAGDASYNGVNLLNGSNLKVVFNESSTSFLNITGVTFTSGGLGLAPLNGTGSGGFQNDTQVQSTIDAINAAIATVRAQTETFGNNSSTIQTRQSFEQNMINTLQTGSSNLVLADQNQESANLLTLQTRQQLEVSALSIANQANQSVLKLFP